MTQVKDQKITKLTHWKKEFNPDFLGAWSLDSGNDIIVTIDRTGHALVKSAQNPKGEDCFVVWFKESDKPMVLNATNCKVIGKLHSNFIENWVNKKIQLYVKQISAFGDTVEALRVRDFVPVEKDDKSKLKEQIRVALTNYGGEDKNQIRMDLTEKQKTKNDDIEYLSGMLKKLTA